jgi:hypothetical protein
MFSRELIILGMGKSGRNKWDRTTLAVMMIKLSTILWAKG